MQFENDLNLCAVLFSYRVWETAVRARALLNTPPVTLKRRRGNFSLRTKEKKLPLSIKKVLKRSPEKFNTIHTHHFPWNKKGKTVNGRRKKSGSAFNSWLHFLRHKTLCRGTLELFFPVVPRTITWHIKTRFRSQEPPQVFSASLPRTSQHSWGDRDPWIPHKNTPLPLTEASDAHFWRRVFFTPCNKRGKHCRRSLFLSYPAPFSRRHRARLTFSLLYSTSFFYRMILGSSLKTPHMSLAWPFKTFFNTHYVWVRIKASDFNT